MWRDGRKDTTANVRRPASQIMPQCQQDYDTKAPAGGIT